MLRYIGLLLNSRHFYASRIKQRTSEQEEINAGKAALPQTFRCFIPLSGKRIEGPETIGAFAFLFIRKCICKTSSKFLLVPIPGRRVIFFSATIFNACESEVHFLPGAQDRAKTQLKTALPHAPLQQQQRLIITSICRGRCEHKNQSDCRCSSAKSFPEWWKNIKIRRKRSQESGREQEWDINPHGSIRTEV